MDQVVVNFACYENGTEFRGLVSFDMPDIEYLVQQISGAGMAGNMEAVIIGHINAMTAKIKAQTFCTESAKLLEPRVHSIDLRVAQQYFDKVSGTIKVRQVKHYLEVFPKSLTGGSIAPASTTDCTGDYAVHRRVSYIDGEKTLEIDQANMVFEVNGVDYLADVRRAIGKA